MSKSEIFNLLIEQITDRISYLFPLFSNVYPGFIENSECTRYVFQLNKRINIFAIIVIDFTEDNNQYTFRIYRDNDGLIEQIYTIQNQHNQSLSDNDINNAIINIEQAISNYHNER